MSNYDEPIIKFSFALAGAIMIAESQGVKPNQIFVEMPNKTLRDIDITMIRIESNGNVIIPVKERWDSTS